MDYEPLRRFCQELCDCAGTVFFTGVGKSGFIANKISQTLVSTGTKSVYLNPTDALHGDIGIVGPSDILVLFSKSGASSELLSLVPYARAKGAKLVAVTSNATSALADACECHVLLPLERELCPFDLAPVTSTAIQMLFGDTCAVAVMRAKGLSVEAFAMNHPAVRDGKRLILDVRDVMRPREGLPTCAPEDTLLETLEELNGKGFGCVLVVDGEGRLLGTFTDGDLRRRLDELGGAALERRMREVMTNEPRTTREGAKAIDAMMAMTPRGGKAISFMPVVADDGTGELRGLLTMQGLVKAGL